MRILFIATLPPPIHGQSLASEVFLNSIRSSHEILVVNTAKQKPKNFLHKILRNFEVARILYRTARQVAKADLIYLTISESILGNIKDLLTYVICFGKLDKMTIHLHGGAGMTKIMRDRPWLASLNTFFLKRIKQVIVLGDSLAPIYQKVLPSSKIHIVPNFSEDYLFIDKENVGKKFDSPIVEFLYLSNLLPGKGYQELLDAFISLDRRYGGRLILNFAGAFSAPGLQAEFLKKIKEFENIRYHGIVRGESKKKLFQQSHVFCLPTYYPYEGQPISILEAYASGCVVVTTDHSGIPDIFKDRVNGFQVEKRSTDSIRDAVIYVLEHRDELPKIAAFNRAYAEDKFRTSIYNSALKKIMSI